MTQLAELGVREVTLIGGEAYLHPGFLDIVDTVRRVVDAHEPTDELTLPSLSEAEAWARATADRYIAG